MITPKDPNKNTLIKSQIERDSPTLVQHGYGILISISCNLFWHWVVNLKFEIWTLLSNIAFSCFSEVDITVEEVSYFIRAFNIWSLAEVD